MNKRGMEQKIMIFLIVGLVLLAIFFFFIYQTKESGESFIESSKKEFLGFLETFADSFKPK